MEEIEEKKEKDELSEAFGKIGEMLSTEDGQKQISDLISMFSDSSSAPEESEEKKEGGGDIFSGLDLGKLTGLLNPEKAVQGKSVALLNALKPFLKEERRKKIDGASKLLNAATLFKQMGFFKGDD